MSLFLRWLGAILPLALAIIFIPPIMWATDRQLPREVTSIEPQNSPVPGEDLLLTFTGHSFERCDAIINEEIVDSNRQAPPLAERKQMLDEPPGPFERTLAIPTNPSAAPGPALYRSHVCYPCRNNWWRRYVMPICVDREVPFVFQEPQ